jgi:hypothetical protein
MRSENVVGGCTLDGELATTENILRLFFGPTHYTHKKPPTAAPPNRGNVEDG